MFATVNATYDHLDYIVPARKPPEFCLDTRSHLVIGSRYRCYIYNTSLYETSMTKYRVFLLASVRALTGFVSGRLIPGDPQENCVSKWIAWRRACQKIMASSSSLPLERRNDVNTRSLVEFAFLRVRNYRQYKITSLATD